MKLAHLVFWFAFGFAGVAAAQDLRAEIRPERPFAEPAREGQALNFDVRVENSGSGDAELTAFEVFYEDNAGRVLMSRKADANGSAPSIGAVGDRVAPAGGERLFFNPFPVVPPELEIARVRAQLTFSVTGSETPIELEASAIVDRRSAVALALPLRGDVLVWSAHDLMAHHRRFDYAIPPLRAFGMVSNSGRYAYDLVIVDDQRRMSHDDASIAENWFGFGQPVSAPIDGVIVSVRNDQPDTGEWNPEQLNDDPNILFGNHIVIEHNGVYVVLAHLKQGSVRVAAGQRVREGEQIANVGHSGSSLFPHLHVQVIDRKSVV